MKYLDKDHNPHNLQKLESPDTVKHLAVMVEDKKSNGVKVAQQEKAAKPSS